MDIKKIQEDALNDYIAQHHSQDECIGFIDGFAKAVELLPIFNWVKFDFHDISTRPKEYGKYLIVRKDGKVHWETWNGSGWAYNGNVICYWAEIKTGEITLNY